MTLITPHSFKASKVLRHIFIFTALLSITIASVSPNGVKLSPSPSLGLCVCRSGMYCGKTADWIRMSFEMVYGVSRLMSVFDVVVNVDGKG